MTLSFIKSFIYFSLSQIKKRIKVVLTLTFRGIWISTLIFIRHPKKMEKKKLQENLLTNQIKHASLLHSSKQHPSQLSN